MNPIEFVLKSDAENDLKFADYMYSGWTLKEGCLVDKAIRAKHLRKLNISHLSKYGWKEAKEFAVYWGKEYVRILRELKDECAKRDSYRRIGREMCESI